jgi:hypothetical protein
LKGNSPDISSEYKLDNFKSDSPPTSMGLRSLKVNQPSFSLKIKKSGMRIGHMVFPWDFTL